MHYESSETQRLVATSGLPVQYEVLMMMSYSCKTNKVLVTRAADGAVLQSKYTCVPAIVSVCFRDNLTSPNFQCGERMGFASLVPNV